MSVALQGSLIPVYKMAREMARQMTIALLRAVGESCTEEAVESGNYTDRTGNLRSSIGYAICENGRVIYYGGFKQVKGGTEGPDEGMKLVNELASRTGEISLYVVAGMKYASYVADKGYNVLDSAEMMAEKLIKQLR